MRSLAVAVGIVVAYFLAPIEAGGTRVAVRSAISVVLLVLVILLQVRSVVRSRRPALRALEALAVVVPLLVVVSAATYLRISGSNPGAFTEPLDHVGALYLAMMALTTIGFGDIGALSNAARIAVMTQMVLNVAVLGGAVRLIVSVARADRAHR